eukprot:TRINITY_DN1269_c4_g1_i3.p1 TRINITY_DN1269_c4_g1~~TRINITY_DN1269_c4_g1_i3.p1  ORF type:complete len:261 (+),score=47.98 TRINITY_DN1269_c4_g1_i3:805-1587(+)
MEGDTFNFRFAPYFFMTNPKEFVYTHKPDWPKWQLLENPLSEKEIDSYPNLKSHFFGRGLKMISHTDGELSGFSIGDSLFITLSAPSNVNFASSLRTEIDGKFDEYVIHQSFEDLGEPNYWVHEFHVKIPIAAQLQLIIFTKLVSDEGHSYQDTVDYFITAVSSINSEPPLPFPTTYGGFQKYNLSSPLDCTLHTAMPYEFVISGPSTKIVVEGDNKRTELQLVDGKWVGTIIFDHGGTARVLSKEDNPNYSVLLEYNIQ